MGRNFSIFVCFSLLPPAIVDRLHYETDFGELNIYRISKCSLSKNA